MNKSTLNKLLLTSLLSIGVSGLAIADCQTPAAPIIPDGNVASMDELISAQKAMKLYQALLGEYRTCLQELSGQIDPEAENAEDQQKTLLDSHNTSVDSEAKVAEEFNQAVRLFKARQPAE